MKRINRKQFEKLKELVSKAEIFQPEEYERMNKLSRGLHESYFNIGLDDFGRGKKAVLASNIIPYSIVKNKELVNFISDIVDQDPNSVMAIHKNIYFRGDKVLPHKDPSELSVLFILEDKYHGGEFFVDGKEKTSFKKNGDYVTYKGGIHTSREITAGVRETLAVWYSKFSPPTKQSIL